MKKVLAIFLLMLNVFSTLAHQTSTSFIRFADVSLEKINTDGNKIKQNGEYITGVWKVSINALNFIKDMDINNDGYVKWGEIRQHQAELYQLLMNNLKLAGKTGECNIFSVNERNLALETILEMNYIVVPFKSNCSVNEIKDIAYTFYFNVDNDHKTIVTILNKKNVTKVHVLASDKQYVKLGEDNSDEFSNIVKEGFLHIWKGFDHIVFLITLIIGVLLVTKKSENFYSQPAYSDSKKLHKKIVSIVKVVTAFTIAHSITLSIAALEIVSLPVQIIEASIAATLVFAAIHNLRYQLATNIRKLLNWSAWKMAFIFGLFHGFGFANVLVELNLSSIDIAKTLLAFNVGVEIGQIIIVSIVVGILLLMMNNKILKNSRLETVLPVSSGFVIVLGSIWFVERSFNLTVF